jgi:hypothetical protein
MGQSALPKEAVENAPRREKVSNEAAQPWSSPRLEYGLLAAAAVLVTALAFLFFLLDFDIAELSTYGYPGLFAISLISAASIVLPMPGAAAVTGAGA